MHGDISWWTYIYIFFITAFLDNFSEGTMIRPTSWYNSSTRQLWKKRNYVLKNAKMEWEARRNQELGVIWNSRIIITPGRVVHQKVVCMLRISRFTSFVWSSLNWKKRVGSSTILSLLPLNIWILTS
jgi:hypothetical protein